MHLSSGPNAKIKKSIAKPKNRIGPGKMKPCGALWQTESRSGGTLLKIVKILSLATLLALTTCKSITASQSPSTGNAPTASRVIYPDPAQAKADLAAAFKTAAATHKRILLDFGGNWCGDCKALDLYFHDPANQPILKANFILVDINVGRLDANLDLAGKYEVPLGKGVPALAVLSDKGKLLYSQKSGEFEAMRRMESSAVTNFLLQWKP
jgi:thiol:disulfide interchange protein